MAGAPPLTFLALLLCLAPLLGTFLVSCSPSELPLCSLEGVQLVRNLSSAESNSFGLEGLSHITVAGRLHHGTKDLEVWLQTIAPGSGTPVHRHDNEEIFLILKGSGVYYYKDVFTGTEEPGSAPGQPVSVVFGANSTFTAPANIVHQVINPASNTEDLQVYAIVAKPPVHVYVYPSWEHPHDEAISVFPMFWDQTCANQNAVNT